MPGRAWVGLAAGLGAASCAVTAALSAHPGLADRLDWQPALAWAQPWRWWTAAWVHGSLLHLAANGAAAVAVAVLGWRAGAGLQPTLAWALAWPATQALLGLAPAWQAPAPAGVPLLHYGGLSGVLHAGVVVLGLDLALPRPGRPRDPADRRRCLVGAALCAGALAKVLAESPWDPALRPSALLGIDVAPVAHACGLAAGALAWAIVRLASPAGSGRTTRG